MEPILQIPINQGGDGTPAYDTTQIKTIVSAINVTNNRKVIYWSIGNEPDLRKPQGYSDSTAADAIDIANNIKNFSKAMRRASGSFAIKIIGPELAYWNNDPFYTKKKLVDSLVGYQSAGNRCDIMGKDPATNKWWIDYFSFHQYSWDGEIASPSRATAIAKLRSTYNFAQSLAYLKTNIDAANITYTRTATPVKIAVTEANTTYQDVSTDYWNDVKANGFYSGQHWLEMSSIAAENEVDFVNFWSAAEGSLGYMKSDGTKKSTFHHFKMATDNFKYCTNYYTGTDQNSTPVDIANIKTFGAQNGAKFVVVILNQDDSAQASKSFSLRLDNTFPTTNTARIKMNFSSSPTTTYTNNIDPSSTMVLVFDCSGNLATLTTYKQSQGATGTPSTTTYTPIISYADLGADVTTCCVATLTTPAITGATYAWYSSVTNYTTAISGATSNTYTNAAGTHTYKVAVTKSGCTSVDYALVTYNSPHSCCRYAMDGELSGNEGTHSELLNNVPNPSDDKTTIYFSLASEITNGELIIMDIFGKVVQKIPIISGDQSKVVDCSQFTNGIYFYSLIAGGKKVGTKKMVIVK